MTILERKTERSCILQEIAMKETSIYIPKLIHWLKQRKGKKKIDNKMDNKEKKVDNIGNIAKKWKDLSGQKHWEGLLDPLDYDLRRYIIHYGERAQANYDAFNSEKASKYAGSSLYSKKDLFSKVGLENGNPFKYKVTKYFYATSSFPVPEAFIFKSLSREAWSKESNWMGFVAVSTDDEGKIALGRRDILISWRGTIQALEWVNDLEFNLVSAPKIFGENSEAKVHQGWYSIYTSDDSRSHYNKTPARDQVYLFTNSQIFCLKSSSQFYFYFYFLSGKSSYQTRTLILEQEFILMNIRKFSKLF